MVKRKVYIDGQESDNIAPQPSGSQIFGSTSNADLTWGNVLDQQEVISVDVNGQTDFIMSYMPLDNTAVLMFVNGIKQIGGVEYLVAGNVVSYTGTLTLQTSDSVECWYVEDKSWTPADISDVSGWWDAGDVSTIYPTYTGYSVINDGDSEGLTTNAWNSLGNTALSKESGAAVTGDGVRVLRMSSLAAGETGCYQNALTVGKVYRVTGWCRSDGTTTPLIGDRVSSGLFFTGTTSTDWQWFDTVAVALHVGFRLGTTGAVGAANYAEFDNLTVTELPYIEKWADKSRTPVEVLTNGDFETGSPPSDWTAGGGGVPTAQAGARTGGSGTQVLRLTIPIADTGAWVDQSTLTIGKRYHVTGWGRGDGVNGYPKYSHNSVPLWIGTTSNEWQYFDVTITAAVTTVVLSMNGDNATEDYAEWDDVSIVEIRDLEQDTAAYCPYYDVSGFNNLPGLYFDGSDDWMSADTIASDFTGEDKPITIISAMQVLRLANYDYFTYLASSLSGTPFNALRIETTPWPWTCALRDDASVGGGVVDTTGASLNPEVISEVHTGTAVSFYRDGVVTSIDNDASNVGAITLDQFTVGAARDNNISDWLQFRVSELCIYKRALSEAERKLIESYLLRKWNIG